MVGFIKNLFSQKDNYYVQLEEEQTAKTEQQQTQSQVQQQQSEQADNQQSQPQSAPNPVLQQSFSFQNNGQPKQLKGETFAPTYLMPKATPFRRRPGANMESFKELARQVNTGSNQ
ncbi:MAG: hypothetical protein BRC33_02040 [Cyanobacteria bacterium SW_9_44_58]|nr:MAG: hypothetical protein BRC33_02040 [Cyanobacteria bacterium SW_9_44_58]